MNNHPMICDAQLAGVESAYSCSLFRPAILTLKVGQTDLVLACNQGSLLGLCMQDHKFVYSSCELCHPG